MTEANPHQQIYIIEDHSVVREVLTTFIDRLDGFSVGGAAASGEEALDELGANGEPQGLIVLVDLSLPGMNGVEFIASARARHPGLRCLVLSAHSVAQYVEAALSAGAAGYVVKGNPEELAEAVRVVGAGQQYLSPGLRQEPH